MHLLLLSRGLEAWNAMQAIDRSRNMSGIFAHRIRSVAVDAVGDFHWRGFRLRVRGKCVLHLLEAPGAARKRHTALPAPATVHRRQFAPLPSLGPGQTIPLLAPPLVLH